MKLIHYFWKYLDSFLDGFSSRLCFGCKKTYADNENKFFCEDCFTDLDIEYDSSIKNLAFKISELEDFFEGEVIHYPRVHFVSIYDDLTKMLMREFKYRKPHYHNFWGRLLNDYISKNKDLFFSGLDHATKKLYELESLTEAGLKIYLAAVPMHPSQLKKRGFNQAELLALDLKRSLENLDEFIYQTSCGLKKIKSQRIEFLPDLLIRKKNTEKLFDKNKLERLEILKGAFAVNPHYSLEADSLLLVVDDITTTGASFMSIYKALLDSGRNRSDILFLACCGKN